MTQQATFNGFIVEDAPCGKHIPQKQGQQAAFNGKRAEATIYCILKELGYDVERQYPACVGIHGNEIKVDFYIHSTAKFDQGLIIESKWQERSGTADEKLCFLVENIRTRYPAPTMVVYGGGGARQGMIDWLRNQVDGKRLVAVFSIEEFMTWVNRNL